MEITKIADYDFGEGKVRLVWIEQLDMKTFKYIHHYDLVMTGEVSVKEISFDQVQLLINMLNKSTYKLDKWEVVREKVLRYVNKGEYNDEDLFSSVHNG